MYADRTNREREKEKESKTKNINIRYTDKKTYQPSNNNIGKQTACEKRDKKIRNNMHCIRYTHTHTNMNRLGLSRLLVCQNWN